MASILRSSKFVRYIAGFARNVVINTPREFDGNLVNNSQCLCGAIQSPFSSQHTLQHEPNLEKSLKRIDQDVRKSGRISRRDIEDVLEELRNSRSPTTSQSLLVIRCCGNLVPEELPEVRTKLVKEIWNTLNRLNIPMDVSHYNALLRVYLENEHPFSPVEFLADMKEKGIEPNRVTYQRLIARYCQDGDIEGATSVLEHMRQKELSVNESVFNALIVGHFQAGDMESAYGILGIMAQAGLEPSADTYTTLLCGYAKKGDIEMMKKLIEECETKEIYLLDKDFLDICYALVISGHEEHLSKILGKVRKAVGYNHDAVNTILNLVNRGKEEAGYEILKTMIRNVSPEGIPLPSGGFLLRQMVRVNKPLKNILDICKRLEEDGFMDRTYTTALEVSIETGNEELSFPLMEELQNKGIEIRQHYFWPLIRSAAKKQGNKGVINVLKEMKKRGITPNSETLREYVIPSLTGKSSELINILTEADLSVATCAVNIGLSLLKKNQIKEVATLISKVPAYYHPEHFKRTLSQSFYSTKDLESYITIVREIFENLDRRYSTSKEDEYVPQSKAEVVGDLITDLSYNKKEFCGSIESVLKELVDQGLSISSESAEKIQETLGDKMNDHISSLLATLGSGELIPVPLPRKPPVYTPSHQMNIAQLERLIENSSSKKIDVRGLKRQLLTLYYRAKNLEKTEALLNDLEKNHPDFVFNAGIYAQLMDLYAYHENLEKALFYLEKIKEIDGENFKISDAKVLRLGYLISKKGQFDEALRFLEETPRDHLAAEEDRNFVYSSLAWRFLNSLADEGRVEDLDKLFNILVSKEFVSVNNVLLGPLIKVHLVKDNLDKALAKFEECVNVYKATPWKNELTCRLIQAEDAEKLQKLTDLSTVVHGEINSLYDLVFAFVECGRVRQARKILETPGLQIRPQRLSTACERYRQEGLVKPLEDLKTATKDLNHIDRSEIYYQLLLSYIKEDDPAKACGLWTQMQEEDLVSTDEFLITLGEYLQKKGMQVPFVMPEVQPKIERPKPAKKNPLQIFRSLLKDEKYLNAFQYRKEVDNKWNIVDASELIEKLTQNDELDKAALLTLELLDKGMTPINRIFKFVVNKLALAGKMKEIQAIGDRIDMDAKKLISFDNRLCHATIVAGQAEKYLKELEETLEKADSEDKLKEANEKFPRGGAYGILDKHPELLETYEHMSKKYFEKGIAAPINILWTHYFIQGNYEKADQLYHNYLQSMPRIMFQRIVQAARDNHNEELIVKLIDHLKTSKITEGALGNAYSCLLDIKSIKEKPEAIIETFEDVLKNIGVEHLNRTAVLRVKNAYDILEKPFNHKIPLKNKHQTSSSSSSDDVKQRNK